MGILEIAATAAVLFTTTVLLAVSKNRDRAMAALVGVSAGLMGVQVMRVHVFTILVVLWCLIPREGANSGWERKSSLLMLCSGILAVTAVIGDMTVSPTLALQLLALSGSAVIIVFRSTIRDRADMLYGLLAVATASSVLGILQVAKIAPIEIWHAHVSSVGRPIGFYPEPDWLGLFAGLALVLAWRMPLPAMLRTLCIVANGAAFIFAFARAAWIGVAVSAAVCIGLQILARQKSVKAKGKGRPAAVILLVAAGAIFLASNPSFAQDFTKRLAGTVSVSETDISGQARVRQIDGLLEMASTAPWHGHGLSANGRVGVFGGVNTGDAGENANAVNSNWVLAMWVDGQLLALPLIAFLIILAFKTGRTIPGQLLLVVLLNSLFSNATFAPITWLLVGLALCAALDRRTPALQSPLKQLSHRAKNGAYERGGGRNDRAEEAGEAEATKGSYQRPSQR